MTDFGIARIIDATTKLTGAGMMIGTPQYMAPEQLEGGCADAPADMWALGATLYAAVEGISPFEGATLTAVIAAILTGTPPPPAHAGPLKELIGALLAKDPARRPDAAATTRMLAGQHIGATAADRDTGGSATGVPLAGAEAAAAMIPDVTKDAVTSPSVDRLTGPASAPTEAAPGSVPPVPAARLRPAGRRHRRKIIVAAATAIAAAAAAAIYAVLPATPATPAPATSSSSSSSSTTSTSSTSSFNWATATSAPAGGGMNNLVAAAEREGQLNVITLPSNWANYGAIMAAFSAKYHIHITDANPDGSSQDELNAVNQLKGQSRAPDVLDVGTAFGVEGDQEGILAPYQVATYSDIPSDAKASDSTWYADYGGYVAIGYNSATVKVAPTSFKSLLNPTYKNEIAITGNPTQANAAFSAVYAAALANGGSLDNIAPGIAYFKQLHSEGNFVPVTASAATMESGQTPIIIWWDYLLASEIGPSVPGLKIVIPSDGVYASFYDQAISKYAPDPAAARLWEEYLYSATGQNLWLVGEARPIELPTLISDGTVNETAYEALPPAPAGTVVFPTQAQAATAENVVAQQWSSVIG